MRALRFALLPVGIAFGLVAELSVNGAAWSADTIADFAVGCLLIVCGTLAWDRRADSRVGALMSLAGFAWFLGTLWSGAVYLHRGPLVHLLLSYPTGRVRGRLAQLVVVFAYVDSAIEPLASNDKLTLALSVFIALTSVRLFLQKSGPARRAGAPALASALAFAGVLAGGAVARLTGWPADDTTLWGYDVVVASLSIVLFVDLVRGRWADAVVTRLVVDLGAPEIAGTLRTKLAGALGDPSLILGYRLPKTDAFVDDAGHPLEIRVPGLGRTVTPIEADGEEIAVLVHDEDLLTEPKLVESVAAAARLAVANARLQAEALVHASELDASRRRIVETGDAQSRRLEAELRHGPERRLDKVAALITDARSKATAETHDALGRLENDLVHSRRELREFAQGLHPGALTDRGLMGALRLLAERSPVPVELRGETERLPSSLEAALFFVSSEALANVAKHAAASRVSIEVRQEQERVSVFIVDDGLGGADPRRGSGLRGLADRIEALGGRFQVESRPGEGTRLVAEIRVRASGRA
jgi:signal transduction histidine kinase